MSAGWRNFDDFKTRIIDKSKTRVTAFLNIVGHGMAGGEFEQDLADMDAKATGEFALKHKGLIVGIKSAHYNGPEWAPFDAFGRGGQDRQHPGDGGLRQREGAHDRGAVRPGLPAGRHLHARLRRRGPR